MNDTKRRVMSSNRAARLIADDIMQMIGGKGCKQPKIERMAFMVKSGTTEKSIGGLCRNALIGRIAHALDRRNIILIQ